MVRKYKAKNVPPNADSLRAAQQAVQKENKSVREASKLFNVDRITLTRFIQRGGITGHESNRDKHIIFSKDQEIELTNHIKDLDDRFHGLSAEQVCQLAHQYSSLNGVVTPKSWTKNKKAGVLKFRIDQLYLRCVFVLCLISQIVSISVCGQKFFRMGFHWYCNEYAFQFQ